VLLAAVSYRWLEQPFLRMKKRFSAVRTGEVREPQERVPGVAQPVSS